MFKIDLDRLKTDDMTYLRRCMNNHIDEKSYGLKKKVVIVIYQNEVCWLKDGKLHLHRDNDKPAVINYDGSKEWFKNGRRHRDNDQPAIIWSNGLKRFYKRGIQYEPM